MSQLVSVSVVIPNWNGKNLLKICLPSLKQQSFKNFEVIIVDNGSDDGSVSYIKRSFLEFKVIELDYNIGFAPAINLGIQKSNGEFIVLINNDTRLDKNCLANLVKAAKTHPEVGMVAAKMLNYFNKSLIDSAGDYIDAVGHANNIGFGGKDNPNFNKPGYIFLVNGGGSLFKKKMLDQVGLFDEDFFAYFEDVDLCFRAQLLGFKAWYESKAVVYHVHKATSNRIKSYAEYLQFRNMTINIIKNYPKSLLWHDLNWLKIILVNINTIRFMAKHNLLKEALKAELYIFLHFPELLTKRKIIQSKIKVSPEYIISNIKPKKVTLFGLLNPGF